MGAERHAILDQLAALMTEMFHGGLEEGLE
jgi:hypothetical protein